MATKLDAQDRIRLLEIATELGVASWEIISFAQNLEMYVTNRQVTDMPMPDFGSDRDTASDLH